MKGCLVRPRGSGHGARRRALIRKALRGNPLRRHWCSGSHGGGATVRAVGMRRLPVALGRFGSGWAFRTPMGDE